MNSAEVHIPEIKFRLEYPILDATTILAFLDPHRTNVGSLIYVRDNRNGRINVENLNINEGLRGRGMAKAILRAFVKRVGPGQIIHAAIDHETTYKTLSERYGQGEIGSINLVPQANLPGLALTRGLSLCGIELTEISVGVNPPEPDFPSHNILLTGITTQL